MTSFEMRISVQRDENGQPLFHYPKEWSADEVFLQICEFCCKLSEELEMQKKVNEIYRLREATDVKFNGGIE